MSDANNNDLQDLFLILEEHPFVLVSYGLAPNPFGFCYEYNGTKDERDEKVEKRLNIILDCLTDEQIKIVRRKYL